MWQVDAVSEVILATGELSELDELKRDSDVIALRELRSARAVMANHLREASENHRMYQLHPEVHGIGAVRAAELVERGIRSLLHLREAVAKNQACLGTLSSFFSRTSSNARFTSMLLRLIDEEIVRGARSAVRDLDRAGRRTPPL